MKCLLDTNALLWIVSDDPRLTAKARKAYETAEEVWFSVVSLWEIAIKLSVGGFDFELEPDWWRSIPAELSLNGVKRLDIVTMKSAMIAHATHMGDGPSRTRINTTITAAADIHERRPSLSTRSVSRPTTIMLKKVQTPPTR